MRTPWLFLAACAGAPAAHTIDVAPSATVPPSPVSSAPSASPLASKPTFHDRFHPSTYATIHFETNSAAIPSDAGDALALIVGSLAKFPRSVLVEGNSAASEKATLAVARAKAVVDELVRRGVSSASLTPVDHEPVKESTVQFFERPGEQLSLDSGAFDACCRETQSMTPSVSWTSDMQRADSADGRAALIEERASCTACNGEFGPQGMSGWPGCKCRTKDGNKPCTSPRDCEDRCDIGWEVAMNHKTDVCKPGAPCPIPTGQCSEFHDHFGCRGWIQETDAGVRTTKWLCAD